MGKRQEKITWEKFWGHWRTVNEHQRLVCGGCFKVGLYWQGLTHDLSKFSPAEFLVGARYFQGNRSPNNAEREDIGYSSSWLHHKGRNRHHYEYWFDYQFGEKDAIISPVPMPKKYIVEMFMDRVAACKVYQKEKYSVASPLAYYRSGKTIDLLHPETAKLLETLLTMLAKHGEDYTNLYIRKKVLQNDKGSLYFAILFLTVLAAVGGVVICQKENM